MSIRLASQPRYPVRTLSGAPATGSGNCSEWGRPAEWPAMPTIGVDEQAFVGLVAIHNYTQQSASLRLQGAYTVDWGDGSALQNVATNTTAQHDYDYASMPQAVTSLGYKCAIVKATPQAAQNITYISLQVPPTGVASASTAPWLELLINAELCTQMILGLSAPRVARIQRVDIRKNAIANASDMLRAMYSLVSLDISHTSQITSFYRFMTDCISIRRLVGIDMSGALSLNSLFLNNYSIIEFKPLVVGPVTDCTSAFNACNSLQEIGPMDLSSVTVATSMLTACSSLRKSGIHGIKVTHSYANCSLPASALNEIFTNLASGVTGQTITVTGNPGAATCTPSIATAKGWTVVT